MKLSDIGKAQKLEQKIRNCDFFLSPLRAEVPLRIWAGDKGSILETYGDRDEYLSFEFVQEMRAGIISQIEARREEAVQELAALGVDIEAATP